MIKQMKTVKLSRRKSKKKVYKINREVLRVNSLIKEYFFIAYEY